MVFEGFFITLHGLGSIGRSDQWKSDDWTVKSGPADSFALFL